MLHEKYNRLKNKDFVEGGLKLEGDDELVNCASPLRYALCRMIYDVLLSREYVRHGFTFGLTTLGVKISYIKVDSLLKLIVNLLNASSSMKGQDVTYYLLGWLFVYGGTRPKSHTSAVGLQTRENLCPEQMPAVNCDIVIVVRLLNLILVVLELDNKSFSADPSDFEDICNVRHSIDFLKVEVYIIRRLPKRFSRKCGFEALEMPLVSWPNEKYSIEQILLLFSKHKVVYFNRIYTHLVNNGNPLDLQKLRCSGNFQGLPFTLQIETLRHKLVCILQGPFVALHLVYDMDMLAFLGCTHDCTVEKEYGRVKSCTHSQHPISIESERVERMKARLKEDILREAQRYSRMRQEEEVQATKFSKGQAQIREAPLPENVAKLHIAEARMQELKANMEILDKEGKEVNLFQPASEFLPMIDEVFNSLVSNIEEIQGAKVENNKFCASVHYRNVDEKDWKTVAQHVHDDIRNYPRLGLTHGRKVLEVRHVINWDKGKAVTFLLESLGKFSNYDDVLPIYGGDDQTDEDAFKVLREGNRGYGILVSSVPKGSNAFFSLRDPQEVMEFLKTLMVWTKKTSTL
ncbi:hypothetical protein V6N12_013070 [Hibiscus sabdariffa]|uniref:Trehalose 6-phosphate phosphatase n=1 Tax=Hibiscus sabdariffa TaxID=183260 RepID=A0ABR2EG92_9ROSI